MSESHDKIIADKEAKIAALDGQIESRKKALTTVKDAMHKAAIVVTNESNCAQLSADVLELTIDLAESIKMSMELVNNSGTRLVTIMRETKAAITFESNQLRGVAEEAKRFRESAAELRAGIEIINTIRPTIRELMQNQDELNVIRNIIHACAPTIHRERSETSAGEQAGPTPDVQER